MERSNLTQKQFEEISKILKQSEETSNLLKRIKDTLNKKDTYFKDDLIEKTLFKMEKNVLRFRNIVPYFQKKYPVTLNNNRTLKDDYIQNYQIQVSKNEFGYRIILPLTLPKFGEKKKSILVDPLNFVLKEYALDNKIKKFERAVFVVINHISSNTPMYLIRDNDNYEYKDIINVLAFWFLPDDSFDCCSLYSGTQIDNDNFTEIHIVPKEKFADFFSKHSQKIN